MGSNESAQANVTLVRGCFVVTLGSTPGEDGFGGLRDELLLALQGQRARAVVLDCSAVPVMDGVEFSTLRSLLSAVEMLGGRSVLVGLNPGVVMHLVDIDADLSDLQTARDLEDGLATALHGRKRRRRPR